MNHILDLKGPEFLLILTGIQIAAIAIALLARQLMVNLLSRVSGHGLVFDPYEAAYLNGGDKHAFLSAMATLSARNLIQIDSQYNKAKPLDLPPDTHWLEDLICKTALTQDRRVPEIFRQLKPRMERLRDKLVEGGLTVPAPEEQCAKIIFTLVALSPIFFLAVPKFILGLERHRPVMLLVLFSALAIFIVYKMTKTAILRSSKGNAQLADWRKKADHLRANYRAKLAGVPHTQLAMSYALFGVLNAGILGSISEDLFKKLNSDTGYSGSSGCGGGGCGGGGCGGGCGGCS